MSSLTRDIQIDAPREKVWATLAVIGSVQDYSPGVVKSFYTSDIEEGVGASRHCDLLPRGTVEERIVNWRDGEQYSIEIYDGTEIKYAGVAHFTLKRGGEVTTVTQTMDYRPTEDPTSALGSRSMEAVVGKVIEGNLVGLRHFVETREVVTLKVFKTIKKSGGR